MKLSIVTSLYNSEKYLGDYFKSLEGFYTYAKFDFEVIIIANDINEKERQIISENSHLGNIRLVSVERESLYASWNRGIKLSNNEAVTFWNVDDKRFPEAIDFALQNISSSNSEIIYFPFRYKRYFKFANLKFLIKNKIFNPPEFKREIFVKEMHCGPFFVVVKKVFEKIGYFDEDYTIAGDFEWCVRAAFNNIRFTKIDCTAGIFINNGGTLSGGRNPLQEKENRSIYDKYITNKKIIALTPAKNEGWIMKTYINNIKKVADEIIVLDDNSSDETAKICEENGVILLTNTKKRPESGWSEFDIRNQLLEEGRRRGGTHFICLDADELVSSSLISSLKDSILELQTNERIFLRWITLWGDIKTERIDQPFGDLYKDFIFCDSENLSFNYVFLGVARTPRNNFTKDVYIKRGGILHLSHLNMDRAQIKQAWYMCSELIKGGRGAKRINLMYSESIKPSKIKLAELKREDSDGLILEEGIFKIDNNWRLDEILEWFTIYGIEYFEDLNIWHIKILRDLFVNSTKREPHPKSFTRLLIEANNIKNKIINSIT